MSSLSRSVTRTEFRRGIAPWAFAVCAVTLLIALFGRWPHHQQDWPSLAYGLRSVQLLLGPLVAAAACWQAGRERRRHTSELMDSTPRPVLQRMTSALLPVWLAAAAAYLVTWLALVAFTWPVAQYGHPLISPVFGDLAATAMFAAAGCLFGWYVRGWAVAPLTGIGTYQLAVFGSQQLPGNSGLSPLLPIAFEPKIYQLPVWWSGFAYVAWFGGLAAAMLLLAGARRKWLVVLPLAVALAGSVSLESAASKVWADDPASARLVCKGEYPQICMRAAHEGLRGEMEPHIRWAAGLFKGVPTAPSRFVEHRTPGVYAVVEKGADPAVSSFFIVEPGNLGTDDRLDYFRRDAVLQDMIVWDCSNELDEPVWTIDVLRWAHGQTPDDMDGMKRDLSAPRDEHGKQLGSSVEEALGAMSAKERTAWFTDYFAAARSCDPSKVTDPTKAPRP